MKGNFHKSVLDNGLRIVSEQINHTQSVSIGVWIGTGSRHESKTNNGISHFIEHMVFKGTHSRTAYEIATSLESLGGHLNAFTDKELTCYYAHVLNKDIDEALDVLSDLVLYPLFTNEDLAKEKQVVFEEIRNLHDSPDDLIHDYFYKAVFGEHSLGFSTLGTHESVRKMNQEIVQRYYQSHYTSNNIVISAAGKLDHKRLVSKTKKVFHKLKTAKNRCVEKAHPIPNKVNKMKQPINQTHICTGGLGIRYTDNRKYALILMNTLLGSGMSSRLFQNLRENKGLVYSVYSFLDMWSDTGMWGIYTGTSPKLTSEALKSIDEELHYFTDSYLSEDILNRTKNQLTGNLRLASEDNTGRMNRLAKMEFFSDHYISIDEITEHISDVSADEIYQLSNELFENRDRYTAILEPK